MNHTLQPSQRPYVWSIRDNWSVDNGLYYDPVSGEMFSVTSNPYVMYLGRLPDEYLKQSDQLNLVGT
jgi:hypothetical protein